jgi:NAD(P)-dependent dehydrogenase (short-subunit alcohol dehydrogenase family)
LHVSARRAFLQVGTWRQPGARRPRGVRVNFFGVVQGTRAVLPHLRAARGSVVTVTSVGGGVGQPFNPFRLQTSDPSRDFVATELADLDGSAVQTLTGSWLS